MEITDETIDLLLGALADQLQALGSRVGIVVIGGSALTALGLGTDRSWWMLYASWG